MIYIEPEDIKKQLKCASKTRREPGNSINVCIGVCVCVCVPPTRSDGIDRSPPLTFVVFMCVSSS